MLVNIFCVIFLYLCSLFVNLSLFLLPKSLSDAAFVMEAVIFNTSIERNIVDKVTKQSTLSYPYNVYKTVNLKSI